MSFGRPDAPRLRHRPLGMPEGPRGSYSQYRDDRYRKGHNSHNSHNSHNGYNGHNGHNSHNGHNGHNGHSGKNSLNGHTGTGSLYHDDRRTKNGSSRPYKGTFGREPEKSTRTTSSPASTNVTPMSGTDPVTGINPINANHDAQMHSSRYLLLLNAMSAVDLLKNYRVVYDPELDSTLSKTEKKTKQKKLHFQSEYVSTSNLIDPRVRIGLSHYFNKPDMTSKKVPFKLLPQARFVYDKDSLGSPPRCELVMWELPSSVTEPYLKNFLESFGQTVRDIKFYSDPMNAVPLGIVTFAFLGSLEFALMAARNFVKKVNIESPKVDGKEFRIALNDADGQILALKIQIAQEKLRKERKRWELVEKARIDAQKSKERQDPDPSTPEPTSKTPKVEVTPQPMLPKPNTTTRSVFKHRAVEQGYFLPADLVKYVKDRPYIHIRDDYVPVKKILSLEVKKLLIKYDWTRVLVDRSGFFVVFNSLKECDRCFKNEDGLRFFDLKLYMDLCVPEKYDESSAQAHKMTNTKANQIVEETVNLLIEDFQLFLGKDIRERIIAPAILELLVPDKYPELINDLREKEKEKEQKREMELKEKLSNASAASMSFLSFNSRRDDNSKEKPASFLPSFTRKNVSLSDRRKARKNLFPMQHALNYDDEDTEDSDDDELSRSTTPLLSSKREADSPLTTEEDAPKIKKSKLNETTVLEEKDFSGDEEESHESAKKDEDTMDVDVDSGKAMDTKYAPTESLYPKPVYEEIEPQAGTVFDLTRLQQLLRDDEDLEFARRLLANVDKSEIKHPKYWAWKQKRASAEETVSEEESIGILSDHLECKSGSFRSEGFRKIPDSDKIEYLPHRRKFQKPLKTIQNDSEEANQNANAAGSTNSANLHSSRVNRANNRRFAADISAQKQILSTESDILNLNALNKRKKPVSFARSAIHNWGLYALEPISAKEMIIEYVGESIRQQVAEHREKSYLRTGIGSSYLFRIDENIVIDATKKGGIARFINHCCNPSCTAKIIKVDGKKRIVIYALRDIDANEELTYDYKFERETNDDERIRCLCGAPGCKGYLN